MDFQVAKDWFGDGKDWIEWAESCAMAWTALFKKDIDAEMVFQAWIMDSNLAPQRLISQSVSQETFQAVCLMGIARLKEQSVEDFQKCKEEIAFILEQFNFLDRSDIENRMKQQQRLDNEVDGR